MYANYVLLIVIIFKYMLIMLWYDIILELY